MTCTCTTGNSNALAWISNSDRLMFASTDPQQTGSSAFAVLTDNSDRNGIRVITSSFTFVTSMMFNVLTCENVDHSTSTSTVIPISGEIKSP